MKGYKPLTLEEIKKRHTKNSQDKKLHETIEKTTANKKVFSKLIDKSTKQEPFDKKHNKNT